MNRVVTLKTSASCSGRPVQSMGMENPKPKPKPKPKPRPKPKPTPHEPTSKGTPRAQK